MEKRDRYLVEVQTAETYSIFKNFKILILICISIVLLKIDRIWKPWYLLSCYEDLNLRSDKQQAKDILYAKKSSLS